MVAKNKMVASGILRINADEVGVFIFLSKNVELDYTRNETMPRRSLDLGSSYLDYMRESDWNK